jgi:hypothetical protein
MKVRMSMQLRRTLEARAAESGRSFSSEAAERLGRSLAQDEALGSAGARRVVDAVIATFSFVGQSYARGNPDWVSDRSAYRAAVIAVLDVLLAGMPDVPAEEVLLEIEALKSRALTRLLHEQEAREDQNETRRRHVG